MIRFLALCLCTLLLLPSAAAAVSGKIEKQTLISAGKKRTYYLFVPSTIKPAASVPLIVMLHGSGRNGLSLVEKWKDLATKEGIVIVGPDAQNAVGWQIPEDGPDFLHELVEMCKAKYPINPRRVYLFGHSAGAVFALNLSMIESEYFTATAVHAGSWREQADFAVIDYAKRKMPLAIFIGDNDNFFPLASVKRTNEVLKERGFPIELAIMKGHTHWYYDLAPKINQNAWDFLKRHELTEEPRYAEFARTEESGELNKVIEEINSLRTKASELTNGLNTKEQELRNKDFIRDRDTINRIAREQMVILTESARLFRAAADKADQAGKLKVDDKYKQYLSILVQHDRKSAEMFDVLREQAEALLSSESYEAISAKRDEARQRADKLQQEAAELAQKAEQIMGKSK